MTLVTILSGPLKRDLIQLAYEECGQAGYDFELTPEEYGSALRRLNNMLSEWVAAYGIDLGYDFPDAIGDNGSVDDASGIPPGAAQVVAGMLALRIAPIIGKALSAESRAALVSSFAALRSNYASVPTMGFGRNTIRGAGNRRWLGARSPFFPVSTAVAVTNAYEASRDLTPNEDIP